MQILRAYSIYDEKSEVFTKPFYFCHHGEALRAFGDVVSDPKSQISHHPSDYKLYCIGAFDDASGELSGVAQPEFLANAISFVDESRKKCSNETGLNEAGKTYLEEENKQDTVKRTK